MINNLTFKLYGVKKTSLLDFFTKNDIKAEVTEVFNDYLVKIDFLGVSSEVADVLLKKFLDEFSSKIYAETDISLENQLVKILTVRNAKISVGESFTGGGVSSLITSVSGASKVFLEGVVAYSNQAKINRLNVRKETIDNYYPVSSEVAVEMAKGLINYGADIAISTTGIAGPNSDDSNFPVGLCYVAVASKSKVKAYKHKFSGNREEITKTGVKTAIFHAIMALRSGNFDV